MANPVEKLLSPEQISSAAKNYLHCLNLPEKNQILIITDRAPKIMKSAPDKNLLIRRKMAQELDAMLLKDIYSKDYVAGRVEFDNSMGKDDFYNQTKAALKELDTIAQSGDYPVTIVNLGDTYDNREGIYDAASELGRKKTVRLADSLGFSVGDCRVMADMTTSKLALIKDQVDYFDNFFKEHPNGIFNITTSSSSKGWPFTLRLNYDVEKAPFETDMGKFDEDHIVRVRDYNFDYINIPGGETFAAPFPLNSVNGNFWAEGLLFKVENGSVVDIEISDDISVNSFEPSQRKLIKLVQSGKRIPVGELGLGFYKMAGIPIYSDSSVLVREKTGPHIGIGNNASPNEEKELVERLSGDFYHTDFVLDNAELVWQEPLNQKTWINFYPPPK